MTNTTMVLLWSLPSLAMGVMLLPFLKGRRSNEYQHENEFSYLALFAMLGPFTVLMHLWIFALRYRCFWVDYLMYRDQKKIAYAQKEFKEYSDNWAEYTKTNTPNDPLRFEKARTVHLAKLKRLEDRIGDRRYFLEEQVRKGLWDWQPN